MPAAKSLQAMKKGMVIFMKKYYDTLKSITLFEGIDEADFTSLLTCLKAHTTHYHKNRTIFQIGDAAVNVGILLTGQAQVIKEDYYGNRALLTNLDQGMLFGETFVCANIKKLPVSVIATAESDILFIDYRRLTTSCTNACNFHNRIIQNMLRILAMKNLILNQKIEFIQKRSTREKLLAYLSFEAQRAGSNHFTIPFNRQELADYLSVDRSAMSAELCRLRDSGMLEFNKSNFNLLS